MQRNLRMVLILVDGVVNVSGLKQEVGDPAMVESALAELESMGLIECPEAHEIPDASEIETMPAYPSKAVSPWEIETIPPIVASPPQSVLPDALPVAEPVQAAPVAQPAAEMPLVQADTVFDEETAMLMRFAPKYEQPTIDKPPKRSPLSDISGWWQTARKERAQAKEEAIYEQAYGMDEATGKAIAGSDKGPGLTIEFRWSWLFYGAFGLFAVALLVVILFPYDSYRPEFEQRLSRALQDDVKIGEVRLSFLPYPAITLDRVAVGADPYVTMNEVRLVPELGSLLGPRYREVTVNGVRVKESGLGKFSKWFLPAGMDDAAVGRLEITGLALDLAGASIEGLRGSARIDDQHGLNKLVLRGPGRRPAGRGDARAGWRVAELLGHGIGSAVPAAIAVCFSRDARRTGAGPPDRQQHRRAALRWRSDWRGRALLDAGTGADDVAQPAAAVGGKAADGAGNRAAGRRRCKRQGAGEFQGRLGRAAGSGPSLRGNVQHRAGQPEALRFRRCHPAGRWRDEGGGDQLPGDVGRIFRRQPCGAVHGAADGLRAHAHQRPGKRVASGRCAER